MPNNKRQSRRKKDNVYKIARKSLVGIIEGPEGRIDDEEKLAIQYFEDPHNKMLVSYGGFYYLRMDVLTALPLTIEDDSGHYRLYVRIFCPSYDKKCHFSEINLLREDYEENVKTLAAAKKYQLELEKIGFPMQMINNGGNGAPALLVKQEWSLSDLQKEIQETIHFCSLSCLVSSFVEKHMAGHPINRLYILANFLKTHNPGLKNNIRHHVDLKNETSSFLISLLIINPHQLNADKLSKISCYSAIMQHFMPPKVEPILSILGAEHCQTDERDLAGDVCESGDQQKVELYDGVQRYNKSIAASVEPRKFSFIKQQPKAPELKEFNWCLLRLLSFIAYIAPASYLANPEITQLVQQTMQCSRGHTPTDNFEVLYTIPFDDHQRNEPYLKLKYMNTGSSLIGFAFSLLWDENKMEVAIKHLTVKSMDRELQYKLINMMYNRLADESVDYSELLEGLNKFIGGQWSTTVKLLERFLLINLFKHRRFEIFRLIQIDSFLHLHHAEMAVTGQIDKYEGKSIGETYSPCLQGLPWRCKDEIFSFLTGYEICSLSPVKKKYSSAKITRKDIYCKYSLEEVVSQVSCIWRVVFLDVWKDLLSIDVIDSSRHRLLQLPNNCNNIIFSFLAEDEVHDYATDFISRINQRFDLSVTKSWLKKNQDMNHHAKSIVLQSGKMLFEAAVVISTTWAEGFPYLAKYLLNLVCCKDDGQSDDFTIQRHGLVASNLWGCAVTGLENIASDSMLTPISY